MQKEAEPHPWMGDFFAVARVGATKKTMPSERNGERRRGRGGGEMVASGASPVRARSDAASPRWATKRVRSEVARGSCSLGGWSSRCRQRHAQHRAGATGGTQSEVGTGQIEQQGCPVARLLVGAAFGSAGLWSSRCVGRAQCGARLGETGADVAGCQEPVVPNLDETTFGQHVLDEALEERDRFERCDLAMLGAEGDAAFVEGEQAPVGDADAVGVATEIMQYLLGAPEWRFAVHMPAFALERGAEPREALGVERAVRVGQSELSRSVGAA